MKRFVIIFCLLSLSAWAWGQQRTIRILAIGNSFSEDAVEQHLYPIAAADSTVMIIGNLYIGGCSIDRHVSNITNDLPAYSYRKIDSTGAMTTRDTTRLSYAIADEPWDYVSVQQASGLSGMAESYAQLPSLVAWIHSQAPQAQVVFHQTWAYAKGSKHRDFANYNKSQEIMTHRIYTTTLAQADSVGISLVIPSLHAISCARHRTPEHLITRDSYHLNRTYGRYIASATWYHALTGRPVLGNTYCPPDVAPDDLIWAQMCADRANIPLDTLRTRGLDADTTFGCRKAAFPDREQAFNQQLSQVLQYPKLAKRKKIQGRVTLSYMVEIDGTITDIKVEKDIGGGCGQAAIDAFTLVAKSYRWVPALIDGIPIRKRYQTPISFHLHQRVLH